MQGTDKILTPGPGRFYMLQGNWACQSELLSLYMSTTEAHAPQLMKLMHPREATTMRNPNITTKSRPTHHN